jgi:hypothetical protein
LINLGAKATRKEALVQLEEKTEAIKREFQAQLEEIKAIAERGSTATACANTAQPPTFNRNISWAMFWRQFET